MFNHPKNFWYVNVSSMMTLIKSKNIADPIDKEIHVKCVESMWHHLNRKLKGIFDTGMLTNLLMKLITRKLQL